jgi:anti-sigma regulatory factor (Ser/Thr protein kinase)
VRARQVFAPLPEQVGGARRFAGSALSEWGLSSPDAVLLVSELATNAVIHAGSSFEVVLSADGCRLRVEVSDDDGCVPAPPEPSLDAQGGRGLHIVGELADAWGVEAHQGDGKTVWFEVAGRR